MKSGNWAGKLAREITLLFILTSGLLVVACSPAGQVVNETQLDSPDSFTGRQQNDGQGHLETNSWWMASLIDEQGEAADLVSGSEITVEFLGSQFSGMAGCNRYSGSYEVSGESLNFSDLSWTEVYCAGPAGLMEQEGRYLELLQQTHTYELHSGVLSMFSADGNQLLSFSSSSETRREDQATVMKESLANLEYLSEWTESGSALLVNGLYREAIAPDAASKIEIRLGDWLTTGKLANKRQATAVILTTTTGGSGTFYDLALIVEQEGRPVNIATTTLGDRVKIESLIFAGGEILIEMVVQGPDDPMCCPTQNVILTYEVQGDQLVQSSSRLIE